MKDGYIKAVTFLGLVAILTLQCIWLVNTYSIVKLEINQKTNTLFSRAVDIETYIRMEQIKSASGLGVVQLDWNETVGEESLSTDNYLASALKIAINHFLDSAFNSTVSLDRLDSIYKVVLVDAGIKNAKTVCCLVDSAGNIIKYQEGATFGKSPKTLQTATVFINKEHTKGLQAFLINPFRVIFQKMGLLLIATAVIMIFVAYCIISQIRIIGKQNKIAQVREDFSYAMIHDMKTPLSSVIMCANFLHSGRLDDKPDLKEQYFKIIDNEAGHLLKLTDRVLTLSKLESRKLEVKLDTVELRPIFDDLIKTFTAKSDKSVEFALHLREDPIYADEEFMKEVFSNLIDNAVKYSGASVRIEISSERNENYSILKFHDNGVGISEKDQMNIFDKFERASAAKRTKYGGASGFGLGLNYALQVVEAHQGKITINSIEGEFSEFIIYIPLMTKKP